MPSSATLYAVSVTPKNGSASWGVLTSGHNAVFTVTNTGTCPDTYTFWSSTAGPVAGVSLDKTTWSLDPGTQTTVTATYSATYSGSGTLTVTAQGVAIGEEDNGWVNVTVTSNGSVISLTPHNGDERDVAKCVASCFDAVASYATAAYYSWDTPHAVSLVYRSAQAKPMGVVQLDATDTTSVTPVKMSIRLQRSDGTWVSFTNGSTEIFYAWASGPARLAAQFDASGLATGAYSYIALVRSYRADASFRDNAAPLRVLVANETGSAFGAGWSVAGAQRLYAQGDGSVVITDGVGSIAYFAVTVPGCSASCTFTTPAGDFTKVTTRASWPDNIKYDRRYPDSTTVSFYTDGRLAYTKDRFGNQTTFGYNGSNLLVAITDPATRTDSLGYVSNKLRWIKDPGGRVDSITVDASANLTRITDAAGVAAFQGTYDTSHRLTHWVDRRGGAWGVSYDFASKLAADTMPTVTADGQSVRPTLAYSSFERAILVDPASGAGTATDSAPHVTPANVRATVTNARGYATAYALDRFGAATRIEAPRARVTILSRNASSEVTQQISPSADTVDNTWTGPNLTQVHDRATGKTVTMVYDTAFHVVKQIYGDADSLWNYWTSGRLDSTRVGRAAQAVNKYTYDTHGRVLTATDPAGHTDTRYYATAASQNTDSVKHTTRRVAYTYDAFGRTVTTKDPRNLVTSTQYDTLNRVIRVIGADSDTTRFSYDSLYLRSVTDAKGQVYRFVPNALGWVDSDTNPAGQGRHSSFDKNGNFKSVVNRRGQTVTLTYDALDQMLTRTADGQTTTYVRDSLDRFSAVANGESADTLKFDPAGRAVSAISVLGGTRYERALEYDVQDRRTRLRVVSPWADTVRYVWNAYSQLDTLEDWAGGRTSFTAYNADRLPTTITLPNAVSLSHTYVDFHTAMVDSFSTAAVNAALGFKYGFDTLGLLSDRAKAQGDSGRDFRYDKHDRLVRAADYVPTPGQCWKTWEEPSGWLCDPAYKSYYATTTYTYDTVGNRTDLQAKVVPGNRLVKFNGDSLVYDADGNLTTRIRTGAPIQRLYWNSLGQLVAVWTSGSDSVSFGYDGAGRRVRKWSATATTRYLYDGDDLLAELDAAGNRIAEYTYYPGIDRPLSVRRAGQVYYFAQDVSGNVVGLMTSTGAVTNQYRYNPWGGAELVQEGVANSLRFVGRQYDAETGLYYNRARYYDPAVGRFISEDPSGLAGGINPYVYATNNPPNQTDPFGLCPEGSSLVSEKKVEMDGVSATAQTCGDGGGGTFPWWTDITYTLDPVVVEGTYVPLTLPSDPVFKENYLQEQGLQIHIGGVFLSESRNWLKPVTREGVTFQERILATDRGTNLWRHDRALKGSFDLRLAFSDASQGVYYGWIVIQGYPSLWVSGVVYKDTNTGVFERSSFEPSP